jgi:V8-like Glu-specific endopeptidase
MLAVPASSQAIVKGSTDAGAHPNVGALTEHFNGAQVLACTGTLISPTVLVTAAHCTAQLQELGFSQTEVSFDANIGSGSDITCGLTDYYVQPAATTPGQ